jgi:hypothetical protein
MTEEFKKLRNPFDYETEEVRMSEDQALELASNPEQYFMGKTLAQRILVLSQFSALYHESASLREAISKISRE